MSILSFFVYLTILWAPGFLSGNQKNVNPVFPPEPVGRWHFSFVSISPLVDVGNICHLWNRSGLQGLGNMEGFIT